MEQCPSVCKYNHNVHNFPCHPSRNPPLCCTCFCFMCITYVAPLIHIFFGWLLHHIPSSLHSGWILCHAHHPAAPQPLARASRSISEGRCANKRRWVVGAIWNTSVAPILYSSVAAILLLGPAHLSGRMSPAFPATSGRCQDVSWRSRSELVPSAPCLTKSSNGFFCSTLATPFSLMLFPFFVYMSIS